MCGAGYATKQLRLFFKCCAKAKELFCDPAHQVNVSAISVWKIALKHSIGKLNLPQTPDTYLPRQRELHQIEGLSLDEEAATYICKLPALHHAPFDRMLICQAIVDGMTILTPDAHIRQYPVRTVW